MTYVRIESFLPVLYVNKILGDSEASVSKTDLGSNSTIDLAFKKNLFREARACVLVPGGGSDGQPSLLNAGRNRLP